MEANFATRSAAAAVSALGDLMNDLWSPAAADLLRQGRSKQVHYFEASLEQLPFVTSMDPDAMALNLLDALHGSLYRQAVGLDATTPTETLENLLKGRM